MRKYLDSFWDLYWDLHLGVSHDEIPERVRQIGESFNTVLAIVIPPQRIVYENYMTVRSHLDFLSHGSMKNSPILRPERQRP
jgi:hypothetical protein